MEGHSGSEGCLQRYMGSAGWSGSNRVDFNTGVINVMRWHSKIYVHSYTCKTIAQLFVKVSTLRYIIRRPTVHLNISHMM